MENLKSQERQPASAVMPEETEEKGQTSRQRKKEIRLLAPGEMLKRKKMLVYPLFFLAFLGAMWLIFVPSDNDEPSRGRFNVDAPTPEDKGLLSDKRTVYEQSAFEKKQKEKMSTLQDLAVPLEQKEPAADEVFLAEEDTDNGSPSIRPSVDAYQNVDRQLDSFYETRPAEDDQKTLELEWHIQELERQAEEEHKAGKNSEE